MSENNTYVIDPESGAEMTRLIEQDRILTKAMGGLLPDNFQPKPENAVLDLACGSGGWAQEVAFAYPFLSVMGVDLSQKMITYAQSLTDTQRLTNLQFEVMDIRSMLSEFPDASFDFINSRLLLGFMMKEDWPALMIAFTLLAQCMRILRPGGIFRLTECDRPSKTTSDAFETMQDIISLHSYKSGRTFQPLDWAISPRLSRFLRSAGFQNVLVRPHAVDWSMGTPAWSTIRQDFEAAFKLMQPYFVSVGATTDEQWNSLWEQAQKEFYEPDFTALWFFVSAWGQKAI